MSTLYYSHPDFLKHDTGESHPEKADRLRVIDNALKDESFSKLVRLKSTLEKDAQQLIRLIHSQALIDSILKAIPKKGHCLWGNDTILSPGSGVAAFQAVTTVCDAVDKVVNKQANNAFCAVRPPGHHTEPDRAMGFCLFNNIAIAAEYARKIYQIDRIAIVDFDVHHGNGTQAAFYQQPNVLYCATHEMPNYPGTGFPTETGVGNIVNVPLSAGDSGIQVRKKYSDIIFPAIKKFKPELLFISAGFDAHKDDPLASIMLVEDDYRWITQELMQLANSYADNRIISSLEGGYNLPALAASVAAHVETLLKV
jgi:acetoin utilization deacetylase AcuC-like enzyme